MIYLTNRFHVAVRLFSNRSQMNSVNSKNSKNINSITINITLEGIEKIKTEKNDNRTV